MLTDRGPTRSFKAIQATAMVAGKVFLLLGMDREKGALCAPVARWWDTQGKIGQRWAKQDGKASGISLKQSGAIALKDLCAGPLHVLQR
jgi:hypothetical protein